MIHESATTKWNMLCELCFPDAIEIAEVFPGGWLIKDGEAYFILTAQGHKGHELLFFPTKPTPDPDPECVLEEGDPGEEEANDWLDGVFRWIETQKFTAEDGYFLVDGCKQAGCTKNNILLWLYHRCGELCLNF